MDATVGATRHAVRSDSTIEITVDDDPSPGAASPPASDAATGARTLRDPHRLLPDGKPPLAQPDKPRLPDGLPPLPDRDKPRLPFDRLWVADSLDELPPRLETPHAPAPPVDRGTRPPAPDGQHYTVDGTTGEIVLERDVQPAIHIIEDDPNPGQHYEVDPDTGEIALESDVQPAIHIIEDDPHPGQHFGLDPETGEIRLMPDVRPL